MPRAAKQAVKRAALKAPTKAKPSRRSTKPMRAKAAAGAKRNAGKAAKRARARRTWTTRIRPALKLGGLVGLALGVAVGGEYLWRTGWLDRQQDRIYMGTIDLSQQIGMGIKQVVVEGRVETNNKDITHIVGAQMGDSILSIDPSTIRDHLKTLPWVKDALVHRDLDGILTINLTEHSPMALWQKDGHLYLVSRDGSIITDQNLKRFAHLPLLVGDGAADKADEILPHLASYPELQSRIKAAIRVGNRRWNLRLHNGIDIKLPEKDLDKALKHLNGLDQTEEIIQSQIKAIDLRLSGKMIIQTNKTAEDEEIEEIKDHGI